MLLSEQFMKLSESDRQQLYSDNVFLGNLPSVVTRVNSSSSIMVNLLSEKTVEILKSFNHVDQEAETA
jgi:hypothetical protein